MEQGALQLEAMICVPGWVGVGWVLGGDIAGVVSEVAAISCHDCHIQSSREEGVSAVCSPITHYPGM